MVLFSFSIQVNYVKENGAKRYPNKSPYKAGQHITWIMHPKVYPADPNKQDQRSEHNQTEDLEPQK